MYLKRNDATGSQLRKACEWSVSGAENKVQWVENLVQMSGAGGAGNDGCGSGARSKGRGSGLNRPLTARSNITFH